MATETDGSASMPHGKNAASSWCVTAEEATSAFRLDTLWGLAARLGGRVDWNEQDDSAVMQVWLPYRTDEPNESPRASRHPERPSGAGGKSRGEINTELGE